MIFIALVLAQPTRVAAPELLGIPVSVLALIVSLFSITIALVALFWQILKHFLDGGRVKVYLNTAVYQPETMVAVNRSGRFSFQNGNAADSVIRGEALEVAQLIVENPGKVPITIHAPGLHLSGHGTKRHTLVPRMYATTEVFGLDGASTDTVVRLEPYGRVTFLLDYWTIIPSVLKKSPKGRVFLRGYVEVAGRAKRPGKSSRRRRWRIERGAYTSIVGSPKFAPIAVLWKEMYNRLPKQDEDPESSRSLDGEMLNFVLDQAMSKFDSRPDLDAFTSALDEVAKRHDFLFPMMRMNAYWAYKALDRMHVNVTGWTEGLSFRDLRNEPAVTSIVTTHQSVELDGADPDIKS